MISEIIIFVSLLMIICMIHFKKKKTKYLKEEWSLERDALNHKLDMDFWTLYIGIFCLFFLFLLNEGHVQGFMKLPIRLAIVLNVFIGIESYFPHEKAVNEYIKMNTQITGNSSIAQLNKDKTKTEIKE